MLELAPLMLLSYHSGDKNVVFAVYHGTGSDRREVFGGILLCARDLSNGTWIIAIGYHSRKLGRRVCFLSVCFSVTLIFEFCQRLQARVFARSSCNYASAKSKVQLENLFGIGGWTPKGFFAPQNGPANKKGAVKQAKCVEHIPMVKQNFGEKILDQGHP